MVVPYLVICSPELDTPVPISSRIGGFWCPLASDLMETQNIHPAAPSVPSELPGFSGLTRQRQDGLCNHERFLLVRSVSPFLNGPKTII